MYKKLKANYNGTQNYGRASRDEVLKLSSVWGKVGKTVTNGSDDFMPRLGPGLASQQTTTHTFLWPFHALIRPVCERTFRSFIMLTC